MREINSEQILYSSAIEQDVLLELYELDLTHIGGERFRFHSGLNALRQTLIWQGHEYPAYPIKATGFEFNGQGTSNRPKLSVANISGLITGLNDAFDDLVGAIITRRQLLQRFLDAENFAQGNPCADPSQELVSRYVVERMSELTSEIATYELALPSESDGVQLPARVIIADVCTWEYRCASCGYQGGAIADERDNPTTDIVKDRCGKRLSSCKLRFGANQPLPFGGFPSVAKLSK